MECSARECGFHETYLRFNYLHVYCFILIKSDSTQAAPTHTHKHTSLELLAARLTDARRCVLMCFVDSRMRCSVVCCCCIRTRSCSLHIAYENEYWRTARTKTFAHLGTKVMALNMHAVPKRVAHSVRRRRRLSCCCCAPFADGFG